MKLLVIIPLLAAVAVAEPGFLGAVHAPVAHGHYAGPIHVPNVIGGFVEDTPDVKAARASHLASYADEAHRHGSLHHGGLHYAGVHGHGYHGPLAIPTVVDGHVVDTPEVTAAKSVHFAAHAEERARHAVIAPHGHFDGHYDGHYDGHDGGHYGYAGHFGYAGHLGYGAHGHYAGALAIPTVVNGHIDDTPEVKAAKAVHFAAHVEEKARHGIFIGRKKRSPGFVGAHAYGHGYHGYPAVVGGFVDDTADVKAAKSVHFAAHAEANARNHGVFHGHGHAVAAPLAYAPAYAGPYAIPTVVDGHVVDTPEVSAAKAVHFAAHAEERARHGYVHHGHAVVAAPYAHGHLHGYAGAYHVPTVVGGFVDDTPEVKAAKASHFAAHIDEKARHGIIFG